MALRANGRLDAPAVFVEQPLLSLHDVLEPREAQAKVREDPVYEHEHGARRDGRRERRGADDAAREHRAQHDRDDLVEGRAPTEGAHPRQAHERERHEEHRQRTRGHLQGRQLFTRPEDRRERFHDDHRR